MKAKVVDKNGKKVKEVELPAAVFEVEPKTALIHQVITAELANSRQGNADTKTRGRVSGGGVKPWRQKGTGRARAGSIRSPLWKGGGTVFGPHPRSYRQKIPRKMRRLAFKSILSDRARNQELIIVDDFKLKEPATKKARLLLEKVKAPGKVTVIVGGGDEAAVKSFRNLRSARAVYTSELSAYELLNNEALIFNESALNEVIEVLK